MSENEKNKIEIFSAGCKFCSKVENEVNEIISGNDIVVIYNLSEESKTEEYYKAAKKYGINSLPSVVVNGQLLDCCGSSGFNKDMLLARLN